MNIPVKFAAYELAGGKRMKGDRQIKSAILINIWTVACSLNECSDHANQTIMSQPKVQPVSTNSKKGSKSQVKKVIPKLNHAQETSQGHVCLICAQNVPGPERKEIFALGKCDHHVCYVCSARLRVICDQSECPVCREKLDDVIFSNVNTRVFDNFKLKDCIFNERYRIYFENAALKEAFDKLFRYECHECLKMSNQDISKRGKTKEQSSELPQSQLRSGYNDKKKGNPDNRDASTPVQDINSGHSADAVPSANRSDGKKSPHSSDLLAGVVERIEEDSQGLLKASDVMRKIFPDVFGLKNHLYLVHKLKLCDLCLAHNKLFPFEYSYYDRDSLARHTKSGEPNTSHRGHPKCKLCQERFFNTDDLLLHMSRDHFNCHLCGRHDSNMLIYFKDYPSLREHFRNHHFLCERDNCRHEQLTSAFDSEISYQLHLVQEHGSSSSGLSRGESRQQRTIILDSALRRTREGLSSNTLQRELPPNAALVSAGNVATANNPRQVAPDSIIAQLRQQRLPSRFEFPALGQSSVSTSTRSNISSPSSNSGFPILASTHREQVSGSPSVSHRLIAGPSSARDSFVRTVGGGLRSIETLNETDFPPLPEIPKTKGKQKTRAQADTSTKSNGGDMTLEQLIANSLSLRSRDPRTSGKKMNSKGSLAKSNRNVKQKPLKIQLS